MARKLRVEFAGAFYHVIARGNQRRKIFGDDQDRLYYLERLEQYRKRYRFKIYAYVLMSNHVHWLIETGKTPLSKILQGLKPTTSRSLGDSVRFAGRGSSWRTWRGSGAG